MADARQLVGPTPSAGLSGHRSSDNITKTITRNQSKNIFL